MNTVFAFITQSPMSLVIILIVVLLLFGNRLPEVMRNMGKGVTEFKKGMQGLDEDNAPAKQKIAEPDATQEKSPS